MIETINIVNKEVSKTLGIDELLVKTVNQFYWKGVKESIQSGSHTSIRIKNIGTLVTSRMKVNNKIIRIIRIIRSFKHPDKVFKEKTREQYLEEKYSELRTMLARRNDIAKAYKANKDRLKKKHELSKTNLDQPPANNARLSIQDILQQADKGTGPGETQGVSVVSLQ